MPLSSTRNLWRRGRATKGGAIAGGLIGAVGMILLEAVASTGDEPHGDSAAGAGISGGVGGAVIRA